MTGTVTDAGGGLFSGSGAGTAGQPTTTAPPRPTTAPTVATGLRRKGILGLILSEIARDLSMSPDQKANEGKAVSVIFSPAGERVIREQRLLGGRSHVANPLDMFKGSTWEGKYGLAIGSDERIPLANDILGHLTGHPQDLTELSAEEVAAILAVANAKSEEAGGEGVRVSEGAVASHEVECFDVSDKYDRDEYREQLKKQEEELNQMSPEEYLERRRAYKEGDTVRSGQPQRGARNQWLAERMESLQDQGYSATAAERMATEEARGLAALHALDLIAGGLDVIWKLGHRGINSSIGSKWIKKGRLDKLDDYAESIRGKQDKMNVNIEDC